MNTRRVWLVLLAWASLALLSPSRGHAGEAWVLNIHGAIGPATADYLIRGLEAAQAGGAQLVVLQIDTPGGLDTAMRDMIQAIAASPVAVATYVAPSGARAASAGTYPLSASPMAAMAPGTNLGAATPVQVGGFDFGGKPNPADPKPETAPETAPETEATQTPPQATQDSGSSTMSRKLINDAEAYIRALAQLHQRNADWAALAVRESASLPAAEALEKNVIDLIANDIPHLLRQLDGREIQLQGRTHQLRTQGLSLRPLQPDWRNRVLSVLTDPNVAYILLLLAVYGLFFEFSNPGSLYPGVVGGICLLLAMFAFQMLPINYAGLGLIFLGLAFIIAEAFLPSFGVLGIGGVVAFIIGSVILMDKSVPGYGISYSLIVGVGMLSAGFFLWLLNGLARLRHAPPVTGHALMLGALGEYLENRDGQIKVRVKGEIWNAESPGGHFNPGDPVRVVGVRGLRLSVEAAPGAGLDFVIKR